MKMLLTYNQKPGALPLVPERDKVSELQAIYSQAGREITALLSSLEVANYKELQSYAVQVKIEKLIDRLNIKVVRYAKDAAKSAYEESRKRSKVSLEVLGAKRNPDFDKRVHEYAILRSARLLSEDLVKANRSMKKSVQAYLHFVRQASQSMSQIQAFQAGWQPQAEEFLSDIVNEAVVEGYSRVTVAAQIHNYLRNLTLGGEFVEINGRHYNIRKYSKMVAMTRLRQAQSEATVNMCDEYENDLVEVSDHSCECDICEEYEGKVYSLRGATKGYPVLDKLPGFHPNCEHSIIPTSEIAIEMRARYN